MEAEMCRLKKARALCVLGLVISGALVGLVGCATPQPTVSPVGVSVSPVQPNTFVSPLIPPDAQILFHGNQNGGFDLYMVAADGTDLAQLVRTSGDDVEPQWSPDGQTVAFASNETGNYEVYRASADGADLQKLTDSPATDWGPTWSSDGRRLAFASDRDGSMQLYVMNSEGGQADRLETGGKAWAPAWSPVRNELIFVSDRDGTSNLYLLGLDSEEVEQLTHCDVLCERPAWSPDGESIVYMGAKEATALFDPDEIYVISRTGDLPALQLTDNLVGDITPSWSPDGNWITFSSSRSGGWNIYVVLATGGDAKPLTESEAWNRAPVWRP